jgi:hypothetical protein
MVKVCSHNYVPIVGFIENMSGVWSEGELVKTPNSSKTVAPFGRGNVEALAKKIDGKYLGSIPLCDDYSRIEQAGKNTIKSISIAIQKASRPPIPNINEGDKGFVRNVLEGLKATIQTVNEELDVNSLQRRFGDPSNPKTIEIELTDAKGSWMMPSSVHLQIQGGLRPVRNPEKVHGGISISSQELKFALEGNRQIMDSPQALYIDDIMDSTEYGLVAAVQMGKADVWGDDVVNYLSLLDKVFEEVIDKTKLQQAVENF